MELFRLDGNKLDIHTELACTVKARRSRPYVHVHVTCTGTCNVYDDATIILPGCMLFKEGGLGDQTIDNEKDPCTVEAVRTHFDGQTWHQIQPPPGGLGESTEVV